MLIRLKNYDQAICEIKKNAFCLLKSSRYDIKVTPLTHYYGTKVITDVNKEHAVVTEFPNCEIGEISSFPSVLSV